MFIYNIDINVQVLMSAFAQREAAMLSSSRGQYTTRTVAFVRMCTWWVNCWHDLACTWYLELGLIGVPVCL